MTTIQRFSERDCERLTRGLMDPRDVHALGRENVQAILREKGRIQYAHVPDAMLDADGGADESRVARYVMITESALPPWDRVVMIDGIDLREFRQRGSQLLFAHGEAPLPLGHVGDVTTGTAGKRKRKQMVGDGHFTAAEHWDFARLVWEMVRAGILRGGSIGFDILEEREPTKDEVRDYGIKSQFATIASRIRLVEFSAVSLGRDPAAQVIGRARNRYARRLDALCAEGLCQRDTADRFLETVLQSSPQATSYVTAPSNGWAQGTGYELRRPQRNTSTEGEMECQTCGSATCNGGCSHDEYDSPSPSILAPDCLRHVHGLQPVELLGADTSNNGERTMAAKSPKEWMKVYQWVEPDAYVATDDATCNGGCSHDEYDSPSPSIGQLAALQQRLDTFSGELAQVCETVAEQAGVINAQRQELRALRARVASGEAEFREALAARPIHPPSYDPHGYGGHTHERRDSAVPAATDFDDLEEAEQYDVLASEVLALIDNEEA